MGAAGGRRRGHRLGAAVAVARQLGDDVRPMGTAALGPAWTDAEIEDALLRADPGFERPTDVADAVADVLADDGIVAWFQGRAEYGPRAGIGACWPIRGTPTTPNGSTT